MFLWTDAGAMFPGLTLEEQWFVVLLNDVCVCVRARPCSLYFKGQTPIGKIQGYMVSSYWLVPVISSHLGLNRDRILHAKETFACNVGIQLNWKDWNLLIVQFISLNTRAVQRTFYDDRNNSVSALSSMVATCLTQLSSTSNMLLKNWISNS